MSLKLQPNIPANVVEIGNEVTQGVIDGLNAASSPSTGNPIITASAVTANVAAASTTVAGKVELATTSEAVAGTSSTFAVTPSGLSMAIGDPDRHYSNLNAFVAATIGTGASTLQTLNSKRVLAPTSAVGYATLYQGHYIARRGAGGSAGIDWSKRIELDFRLVIPGASSDANSVGRVILGKASNSGVAGDPSVAAMGIRFTNGGNFVILAHDGTTLSTTTTSTAITGNIAVDISLVSNGSGTIELFVNGVSAGTRTGGPTGIGSTNENGLHFEAENINILTGNAITPAITNFSWKVTQ